MDSRKYFDEMHIALSDTAVLKIQIFLFIFLFVDIIFQYITER